MNKQQILENVYRIADYNVKIRSLYMQVHELCSAYRADVSPELFIATGMTDINFERERLALESRTDDLPPQTFSDSYLETLAVCRKLAEKLLDKNIFLFHGSAIAVDGDGYLFTAKGGTGKSTHSRLWCELLGERVIIVNDDKPLLKITDKGVYVYGTPWAGKHHLSNNISVPLKALCILERSKTNTITPVPQEEAWPILLQQSYRPLNSVALSKTLVLVDCLAKLVPLFRLRCNMETEAAATAYEGIKMYLRSICRNQENNRKPSA